MVQRVGNLTAIRHDISNRSHLINVVNKEVIPHSKLRSARTDKIRESGADAIKDENAINDAVTTWCSEKRYSRAAYLIFSTNGGLRYGDNVSLRVKDVFDEDGKIIDGFCLIEGKTKARRSVYINEAMKEVLEFIVKYKNLQPDDFIFTADGNRKSYFKSFVYDENGDIIDVETTGEKHDEDGKIRKQAPISNKTACRWYDEIKTRFGAKGHFSSHSGRNTFRYFISKYGEAETYEDIVLASQCLGHASVNTTINHYCKVSEETKRNAANSLNLGLSAFKESLKYIML